MPPPIPVMGSTADVAQLTGHWSGEYHGAEASRSGTITFTLEAARDTAFGEVLMVPRRDAHRDAPSEVRAREHPTPQGIPIRFVLASSKEITGELEPYQDPECECELRTQFSGRLAGDTIEGRYSTRHLDTGAVTHGTWKVTRRSGAAADAGSESSTK